MGLRGWRLGRRRQGTEKRIATPFLLILELLASAQLEHRQTREVGSADGRHLLSQSRARLFDGLVDFVLREGSAKANSRLPDDMALVASHISS
jgi:hypothetical protein